MHKASIVAVKRTVFSMIYTAVTDMVQRKKQIAPQYFHVHESVNSQKVTRSAKFLLMENAALQY